MQRIYDTILVALSSALRDTLQKVVEFLPNLVSALLILVIGWVLAKSVEKLMIKLMQALHVDQAAERRSVTSTLRDLGINRSLSALLSRILYWVIWILFLVPALETLRLVYVSQLVGQFVSFIPNIIASILIFLVGVAISRLLGGSVGAAAKSAGLEYAQAVGMFVTYFLMLIVIILSLSQLGVRTDILTNIFTVLIVSLGLALALALGLGSRAVVANILAGAFAREHFPAGRAVEVQGIKGKIIEVGAVGTAIESDGKQITVPNTLLMENVVE